MYIYMKLKLISNATNNHSFTHSHTDGGVNHEGRLAQRRLDAQLGGAGDRTSDLLVTNRPLYFTNIFPC